jgi:hypothetical protein
MRAGSERDDMRRSRNEVAARAALEVRVGHSLPDAEWASMRARLVEFTSILRAWDRAKPITPLRGNVEVPCQPEP